MKTKEKKPVYLSLPEVAERKGVTRQAVWQAVIARRLKAERFGNSYFVTEENMNNWEPRG